MTARHEAQKMATAIKEAARYMARLRRVDETWTRLDVSFKMIAECHNMTTTPRVEGLLASYLGRTMIGQALPLGWWYDVNEKVDGIVVRRTV